MKNINELISEFDKLTPTEFGQRAINNEIQDVILGYYASKEPEQGHPYIRWISKSILMKNQAKILETQSKYMMWSAIGACLAAIFSLISIFVH